MDYEATTKHLCEAKQLIDEPGKWTRFALARDENGDVLPDPQDPNATQWCVLGAVHATHPVSDSVRADLDTRGGTPETQAAEARLTAAAKDLYCHRWWSHPDDIASFNDADGTRYQQVVDVFQHAILMTEAEFHAAGF